MCPIDREDFLPTDYVLQIRHCNHIFREDNLRRHFRTSTRCPLCRFDVRDYAPPLPPLPGDVDAGEFFSYRQIPRIPPPPPPPPPPFDDLEDPFATRPSPNINPSYMETPEIAALLGGSREITPLDGSSNDVQS